MPARKDQQAQGDSPLAQLRISRGVTQAELAEVVGLSVTTLARLEHDRVKNPPLGWYMNCAIALDAELHDVLGDEQLVWKKYSSAASAPPPEGWIDAARERRGLPPQPSD